MPVTRSQQHTSSSADPADTTMEESASAEPLTLTLNSMDAITHFRCNVMGEQQKNGPKQPKGNLEDHQSTKRPRGSLLAAQLVGIILRMNYPDCRALLGL